HARPRQQPQILAVTFQDFAQGLLVARAGQLQRRAGRLLCSRHGTTHLGEELNRVSRGPALILPSGVRGGQIIGSMVWPVGVLNYALMPRYFALIPAAGHSTRMGQSKLLLPLAGQPL